MNREALATIERETYQAIWALDAYGTFSPGETHLPIFLDMTGARAGVVLDAGCGTGKGALALRQAGFDVALCDLTNEGLVHEACALPFMSACLWHPLQAGITVPYARGGKFDYVYCCDVLEHVPLPFTMLVVRNLLAVARRGVFLTITLQADQFGAFVGKALHQSVQSFTQWRDQLAEIGMVQECRDLLTTGVYLLVPRC